VRKEREEAYDGSLQELKKMKIELSGLKMEAARLENDFKVGRQLIGKGVLSSFFFLLFWKPSWIYLYVYCISAPST